MSGITDVQARISAIQSQFAAPAAMGGAATSGGLSFDQILASAQSTLAGTVDGSASIAGGSGVTGAAVVTAASKYLGVPYVWGGTDPKVGLDCSGFVQRTFKDLGIDLPRLADAQAKQGVKVASLAQAQPGDLVAFDNAPGGGMDHIGIYVGNGKMIVAPRTGENVKIQNVGKPTVIRRIVGTAGPAPVQSAKAVSAAAGSGVNKYNALFASAGAKYGVPALLLKAVAQVESQGNPNASSPAGAIGLMQITPSTAKGLGVDPTDPTQSVDGAAKMLAGLIRKFGTVDLALAAYNAGEGNVSKYGGIPPFPETQKYVPKVKAVWASYR